MHQRSLVVHIARCLHCGYCGEEFVRGLHLRNVANEGEWVG